MCNQSSESNRDLITLITHYGNMRFAMFTVFSGVLGALISFPFTDGGRLFFCSYPAFQAPLSLCGIGLSLLFTFAELRISYLLTIYQSHFYDTSPLPRPKEHGLWAVLASITMVSPFVISALFWISYWLSNLTVPGCPQ